MAYTYKYPRPALTTDCVVFGLDDENLKVLLIQRAAEPYQGQWALPGGFVNLDETLEQAARLELEEETGIRDVYLEQLYTFGALGRDPRERIVSVAFYALVRLGDHHAVAASDARAAEWFTVSNLPPLAFDHEHIFQTALARLKNKVRYQPLGFELLPPKFTLSQLQRMYEIVLARPLDKRNFRKKILSMELLIELDEVQKEVAHRAARLYRCDTQRYQQLVRQGFNFEV